MKYKAERRHHELISDAMNNDYQANLIKELKQEIDTLQCVLSNDGIKHNFRNIDITLDLLADAPTYLQGLADGFEDGHKYGVESQ